MKRPLLLLMWLLTAVAVLAEEESRTWTDQFGRTLTGTFVEANRQEVIVRRPDGTVAHIPRESLSADDLAYADKSQAAKPITVTIDASRSKFTTKRTEAANMTTFVDDWGFNLNLTNTTLLTGRNLRADYVLYYRRTKKMGDDLATQPLSHQAGSEPIDSIDPKLAASFHTSTVAITTEQLREGTWAVLNSGTYVNTKLDGIWVRIYENDQMIGEYVSSEDYRKEGWPGGTPAPKATAKKKPAAKPAAPDP